MGKKGTVGLPLVGSVVQFSSRRRAAEGDSSKPALEAIVGECERLVVVLVGHGQRGNPWTGWCRVTPFGCAR